MATNNKLSGNRFEAEFARNLFDNGFWVHMLTQSASGQPADLIAGRGSRFYLIDCKECAKDEFPLKRVEPNQQSAMDLWENRTNELAKFAIKVPSGQVWMLDFRTIQAYIQAGRSSMKLDAIMELGETLEEWVKR